MNCIKAIIVNISRVTKITINEHTNFILQRLGLSSETCARQNDVYLLFERKENIAKENDFRAKDLYNTRKCESSRSTHPEIASVQIQASGKFVRTVVEPCGELALFGACVAGTLIGRGDGTTSSACGPAWPFWAAWPFSIGGPDGPAGPARYDGFNRPVRHIL